MRPTSTLLGQKALEAISKGVNRVYEPVRKTFGPYGLNALLFRSWNRGSRMINDGYTVSECQIPKNVHERIAAETFKEACKRTNEKVGDGTTLTTILAGNLFNRMYQLISEQDSSVKIGGKVSQSPVVLKKRILENAKKIIDLVEKSAKQVKSLEELERIATISVEDEELGKIIAAMAWEVGVDGFIDVVEGYKGEIETEVIKGMRFPAKIAANGFVNNVAKFEMVAVDSPVFITNYELDNPAQLAKVINPFLTKNPKLIIIAPRFSQTVLIDLFKAMYTVNVKTGERTNTSYNLFPVAVPSLRTPQFEDLAIYCGARFIDKEKGSKLQNAGEGCLGFLEKLIVKGVESREDAMAIGGAGTMHINKAQVKENETGFEEEEPKPEKKTAIEERIELLKGQLKETRQENFKKLLERRIASMASAVGVIRVGDSTDASALYRKLKIEDAVYACKAALRSGYVKGGGLCLKEIADNLKDDILKETIIAPYEQIQESVEGGVEITEDIIDPVEVITYGLKHATQVVAEMITCYSVTEEIDDPSPESGAFAIAKWLREGVMTEKIKEGQIKESEAEVYREQNGGLTDEELISLDNG